jgi:hypothetical protein
MAKDGNNISPIMEEQLKEYKVGTGWCLKTDNNFVNKLRIQSKHCD